MEEKQGHAVKDYEFGWKKAHVDQLITYMVEEEVCARYRETLVALIGEYILIYDFNHMELSVHFKDEGLWVFTINVLTGEYESAFNREMNRALLIIFAEIGMEEYDK